MAESKRDTPSAEAFYAASLRLGCEVAAIRAVAEVEAGKEGAFLPSGEPVLLFEPHIFSRLTGGKYDGRVVIGPAESKDDKWRQLSYKTWRRGWYGPVTVQHRRLAAAAMLNRDAALKACSWGAFQILGLNHKQAGHPLLQDFVNAMYRSVDDHLAAFVAFILADPRLTKALAGKQWAAFARRYNGPGFAKNLYPEKMAEAYSRNRLA